MPTGKKITKQMKQEMVDYYKSKPMTFQDVANHFGYCLPTIGKIMSEYKVKLWSKFQLYSPDFNEDYFESIDNEHKAYFLGLMTADGNVFDNYKSKTHPPNINLTLQEKDKYILEELKKELMVNKQLNNDGRGCFQLAVFSHKMANDLKKYSVVPCKSLTIQFPQDLPKELYRHYIRGYFDGDGSASFYAQSKRPSHVKAVRFCSGSYNYLSTLSEYISKELNITHQKLWQEKDMLWSIAWRGMNDLEVLIHWLYDDATIYFSRKKQVCDLILNDIGKYRANYVA